MWKAILITTLIAGTLDICAALIDFYLTTGNNPSIVLPYIASGVFGKAAFANSSAMMWTGLLLHYLITFFFTCLFFLLCANITSLLRMPALTAIVYGAMIWLIMNLLVLPSSHIPERTHPAEWTDIVKCVAILIVCIGLPSAFIARRHFLTRKPGNAKHS